MKKYVHSVLGDEMEISTSSTEVSPFIPFLGFVIVYIWNTNYGVFY